MDKTSVMNKTAFDQAVEKVGGPEKAAELLGVSEKQARNFSEASRSWGVSRFVELRRAAGMLPKIKQPTPGNGAGDVKFFSCDELRAIQSLRFEDTQDGFQRGLNENQVAQIELAIRNGQNKYPPIVVGRLPDKSLIEIDGQHRRSAYMRCQIGAWAQILAVKDLEEARYLYLSFNRKARKPTSYEAYMASRNNVSEKMKGLEIRFALTYDQVYGLFCGLNTGKVDFVEPDSDLTGDVVARANVILKSWTGDSRWGRPESKIFNSAGVLRALGIFARQFSPNVLEKAIRVILGRQGGFHMGNVWCRTLKERGAKKLSQDFETYVTPVLMGGVTGMSRNRGGRH